MIAYIISPLDLLPEGIIGPAGYAEDIALAAYVINHPERMREIVVALIADRDSGMSRRGAARLMNPRAQQ
jgi:uncharacterized membrane protein YkvA (DUF1232 family)